MGEITMDMLPMMTSQQSVMQSTGNQYKVNLYNQSFLAGVTPILPASKFALIKRVWCIFGANESSGTLDASNNTQVAFYADSLGSSSPLATLNTHDLGTYAAGDILSKSLHFVIPRNKLLYVKVTRIGSGSSSMQQKQFAFGFDIHIEEASG